MKKFIIAMALVASSGVAQAHWFYNSYGIAVSNICRAGYYWAYVPYAAVDTACYIDTYTGRWYGSHSPE